MRRPLALALLCSCGLSLALAVPARANPTLWVSKSKGCSWKPCWALTWIGRATRYVVEDRRRYTTEYTRVEGHTYKPEPGVYSWGRTEYFRVRPEARRTAWSNTVSIAWPLQLWVEGQTLYWHGYATNWIVERKPGPVYTSVLRSHEYTPPATPGRTYTFRVHGKEGAKAPSAMKNWSNKVSITYPGTGARSRPGGRSWGAVAPPRRTFDLAYLSNSVPA